MKSLDEFKNLTEELSDYSKFDILIRAGLANKAQMQRIHKILEKMKDDKPVFSPADRAIIQNMFNRMVDLLSNNKQIFTQAKRAVREEVELEEKVKDITTSDYKISQSGRKVPAHRFKVGEKIDKEDLEEANFSDNTPAKTEPPPVLILKRKSIRLFSDGTKVGLYYNKKIDKYFTVAFRREDSQKVNLQAEKVEQIDETVMDQLHKIVANKQSNKVKFATGETRTVDHFTASAITQVHKALNDENKKKFADMVHKSPAHLSKASDFAFKHSKK